jgi:hypothetical protein
VPLSLRRCRRSRRLLFAVRDEKHRTTRLYRARAHALHPWADCEVNSTSKTQTQQSQICLRAVTFCVPSRLRARARIKKAVSSSWFQLSASCFRHPAAWSHRVEADGASWSCRSNCGDHRGQLGAYIEKFRANGRRRAPTETVIRFGAHILLNSPWAAPLSRPFSFKHRIPGSSDRPYEASTFARPDRCRGEEP